MLCDPANGMSWHCHTANMPENLVQSGRSRARPHSQNRMLNDTGKGNPPRGINSFVYSQALSLVASEIISASPRL